MTDPTPSGKHCLDCGRPVDMDPKVYDPEGIGCRTCDQPDPLRKCVEPDCDEPAGTPWTDHWCARHDEERRARIGAQMAELDRLMGPWDGVTEEPSR